MRTWTRNNFAFLVDQNPGQVECMDFLSCKIINEVIGSVPPNYRRVTNVRDIKDVYEKYVSKRALNMHDID